MAEGILAPRGGVLQAEVLQAVFRHKLVPLPKRQAMAMIPHVVPEGTKHETT
ncbi:MAG: hypothetical protein H7833_18300 [Magnetococcus sp. DMHC-1]|nr:hypothetical protein [Magnetococcales bacterium]